MTLEQASQEYATELAEMGVDQTHIPIYTLCYIRGWQEAQKEETS